MKVIIYTLNEDGTIPTFVVDGGYFAVANQNSSPQDFDLLGIATDDAPQVGFADKQALSQYFQNNQISENDSATGEAIPTETLVNNIWNKLV